MSQDTPNQPPAETPAPEEKKAAAAQAAPSGLSQAEVDVIFASIQPEQASTDVKTVRSFTFQKPEHLSADKLQRLRTKHENLVHELGGALSLFFRKDCIVRLSRIETITHSKLIDTLPAQTHLTLFHLSPLAGAGVMEVTPSLALTIVSRMLGSQGHAVTGDRNLTEIDLKMVDRFVEVILREYTSMWRVFETTLDYEIDGHDHSPRFLKLGEPDSVMVFLVMEVKFGTCAGFVRMGIPYIALEPLIAKLMAPPQGAALKPEVEHKPHFPLQEPLMDVPINVRATWTGLKLKISELENLRKDDIFVLSEDVSNQTALFVSDVHKFSGQIGRKGERLAVRIDSKTS
jgi:flagellar motor switch protein FliM